MLVLVLLQMKTLLQVWTICLLYAASQTNQTYVEVSLDIDSITTLHFHFYVHINVLLYSIAGKGNSILIFLVFEKYFD